MNSEEWAAVKARWRKEDEEWWARKAENDRRAGRAVVPLFRAFVPGDPYYRSRRLCQSHAHQLASTTDAGSIEPAGEGVCGFDGPGCEALHTAARPLHGWGMPLGMGRRRENVDDCN